MILISNYHLYAYTGIVTDTNTRELVGLSQLVVVSFTVVVNLGVFTASNLSLKCN